MLAPKKTLVGLAGQKAWHICAGEAAPRISGKYLPSQLRTQKAGPALTTTGRGGGDCGSKDEVCCIASGRHRKKIKQAFGRTHFGRQRHGANDGGSNKHAAQLALKGQFGTQRLLHRTSL